MAHFIAGTSCLCRLMMDRAITQIDVMLAEIKNIQHIFRPDSNLDQFEEHLRRALYIMYDEPDQWRIRGLRKVMGKVMNVCFPILLKSVRWNSHYKTRWTEYYQNGFHFPLQIRVVNDHRWLYKSNWFPRNADIMRGFDHMEVMWIRYRDKGWKGWKPEDDLMFPDLEDNKQPAPLSSYFSAPPTPAGGKKKSKAIPIIKPVIFDPLASGQSSTTGSKAKGSKHLTGMVQPGRPKVNTPVKVETAAEAGPSSAPNPNTAATSEMSPGITQATPSVEDPFDACTSGPATPVVPSSSVLQGSAMSFSYHLHPVGLANHRPLSMLAAPNAPVSLPGTPARMEEVRKFKAQGMNGHLIPLLPDGDFHFAENSQGVPDSKYSEFAARPPSISGSTIAGSNAPSVAGMSSATASGAASVSGKASAAESSSGSGESPTLRLAELNIDGANDNADPSTVASAGSTAAKSKKKKSKNKNKNKKKNKSKDSNAEASLDGDTQNS